MKLKYKNASQTLIIELELKNKKDNQPVFTASGSYYDSLNILHDKSLISAGQCLDCIPDFVKTMTNKREIKELLEIYDLWNEFHLNDMCTWCEHMNYGNFPKTDLSPEGLLGKECPVCGAKYGHSWYYRPIPASVIKKIKKIIGE